MPVLQPAYAFRKLILVRHCRAIHEDGKNLLFIFQSSDNFAQEMVGLGLNRSLVENVQPFLSDHCDKKIAFFYFLPYAVGKLISSFHGLNIDEYFLEAGPEQSRLEIQNERIAGLSVLRNLNVGVFPAIGNKGFERARHQTAIPRHGRQYA